MKTYSIIFNQANANVTLVEQTEQERAFMPFDSVSELIEFTNASQIDIPLSRVFAGYEAFKASL